jgi:hypothetical protein
MFHRSKGSRAGNTMAYIGKWSKHNALSISVYLRDKTICKHYRYNTAKKTASATHAQTGQPALLHQPRIQDTTSLAKGRRGSQPSKSELAWWMIHPETPAGTLDTICTSSTGDGPRLGIVAKSHFIPGAVVGRWYRTIGINQRLLTCPFYWLQPVLVVRGSVFLLRT